ncbi:MAG: hypothetical protein IKO07_11700 [Clostridia bacterium]|nr:hypothetical protein [Clostridia bacterium]
MTTAFAAGVPSKTTTTTTTISTIAGASGQTLPDKFGLTVVPDTAMTADVIEDMYEFVSEGGTLIDYFEPEVQNDILAHLNANKPATEALTLDDLKDYEINEVVSVDAVNYEEGMDDVVVNFDFATPYEPGQKLIAILDCFNGERVEVAPNEFEWVSDKYILDAEVVEVEVDGKTENQVAVTFTEEALRAMNDSVANTLSILSEPLNA